MIKKIKIVNWKVFDEYTIEFAPSINFLTGANGAGKSTILDAICLAFTGESLISEMHGLVKDHRVNSIIHLVGSYQDNEIDIYREFNKDRKLKSSLKINNIEKAKRWDDVSTVVLSLFGIDRLYFTRLIYMSEGEVFNYLNDPPREAIRNRVRAMLGIENMELLRDELNRLRIDNLRELQNCKSRYEGISLEGIPSKGEIEGIAKKIDDLRNQEKKTSEEKLEIETILEDSREKEQLLSAIKVIWTDLEKYLKGKGISLKRDQPLLNQLEKLIQEEKSTLEDLRKNLADTEIKKGKLESKAENLNNIRKLLNLLLVDEKRKTVPCPVCKKPITLKEAKDLMKETMEKIEDMNPELNSINSMELRIQDRIKVQQETLDRLSSFNTKLGENLRSFDIKFRKFNLDMLEEIIEDMAKKASQSAGLLNRKEEELEENRKNLEELNIKKARYEEKVKLSVVKKELQEVMIDLNKKVLINEEILIPAIEETINMITNKQFSEVYSLLSSWWNSFRKTDWKIRFDEEGRMELRENNRIYDFSQLSGGEKTILLVLARVMLCGILSKIDFLLIDEPLEHLDMRNRRSLVNFLAESCRKKLIKQMIVTTFEETLLRPYFNDPTVHIKQVVGETKGK